MAYRPVHWHEGMFLRPHHFQAAQRCETHVAHLSEKWDLHHNWGLRHIELDEPALGNHRLVIRALQVRLRDGTLVSVPEDGNLPQLDLKEAFAHESSPMIYLAIPVLRMGRNNIGREGQTDGVRYQLYSDNLDDENTGQNPQPIQFRLLNLRLLLSADDQAGYETIPIARLRKSSKADALPELDPTYIPPILACDAWKILKDHILEDIYDRIGKQIDLLARQVTARGISMDSHGQGDPLIMARLRECNEAYAVLGVLAFAPGVHPLTAYVELCRLVGQLSIFGQPPRLPALPRYDHDDLGHCFYQVKHYIVDLLGKGKPKYDEVPFEGMGTRMQVSLQREWLDSDRQMYVGVRSSLDPDECIKLLTQSGQLNMKIGSAQRVPIIYQMGAIGLRFGYCPHPPQVLPPPPGMVYLEVVREAQEKEWDSVRNELTLAIQLNKARIEGDIEGLRTLSIRHKNATTDLQFTLFVVRQGA